MRVGMYAGIVLIALFLLSSGICFADITIHPEYLIGDEISISGYTNYNTDNSVLVEVWPASFGPKGKYESSMTGGGSTVVPVMKENASAYYWNATFNSSTWNPDLYMVRAEVIGKDYAETTTFVLTEKIEGEPAMPQADKIGDNSSLATSINDTESSPVLTQEPMSLLKNVSSTSSQTVQS